MEDDGRRWTLRLRKTYGSTTANRCGRVTASHRSNVGWCAIRAGLRCATLDAIEAPDGRTIVLRLNKPFPQLRTLLSKFIIPAVMMPERLAQTDPFKQIPEAIGSGPFRWLADEHVLGSHAAFARFDRCTAR